MLMFAVCCRVGCCCLLYVVCCVLYVLCCFVCVGYRCLMRAVDWLFVVVLLLLEVCYCGLLFVVVCCSLFVGCCLLGVVC